MRSELGTAALTREVQALRCGLDATAWEGSGWKKCHDLVDAEPVRDKDGNILTYTLPFDLARANALYKALFGGVDDLIGGKSLLIVPSGPLTQLPLHVLVSASPKNADDTTAAWLIRDHGLTVLPAVSSLRALRHVARPSVAQKPMIGFGNPLLDGDPRKYADDEQRAQDARDFKRCRVLPPLHRMRGPFAGVAPVVTRGGLADAAFLRMQAPLPETALELCAVARDVGADLDEIYLGANARESKIKDLSDHGKLAEYRIVHFATHGALAGQVR